jgi:inner membrane protein
MDALTHGLASYALTRVAFPNVSRATTIGVMVASVVADVDVLSANFGPAAFLSWHRTYSHSSVGAVVIAALVSCGVWLAQRKRPVRDSVKIVFAAAFGASVLHVGMDLCQNDGIAVLWPFRSQRYSADFVAYFDLWILLILLAGVLLPQLLRLVSEEIGAKSKAPRGRIGAMIALVTIGLYIAGRAILHGNAVAMMESRTYRGELARRVAAFAESDSPLRWHGIVETERALHDLEVELGPGASFSPDSAMVSYKPAESPALAAARYTVTARRFLQVAKFPKATVEQTRTGFRVEIREFSAQRGGPWARGVAAVVKTDSNARITNEELVWDERSVRGAR